ncbi:NAD(P)H-dependent oxidoreductase [Antrihabitans cavernicola]|uniref:NAD(P)H-dependent oxidoreductase n=2 Tax=Antrihabitans cavernicola TaxID=2495913 RepID=A0A5A7S8X1_9NOCA|nr:NAD(P)H-dependent oxidoreductase [Spelaeibacter cavernicola]
MRIVLISGSTRSGSTNTATLRTVAASVPDGVVTELYDGLADLPAFNPDDDQEPLPATVAALRNSVAAADAVLFCTPEYAGTLPGSFKNLLDWLVGSIVMSDKPTGWINVASVAAPNGGSGAHDAMRTVLGYIQAKIVDDACIRMPLSRNDVGADGLLVGYSDQLEAVVAALGRA